MPSIVRRCARIATAVMLVATGCARRGPAIQSAPLVPFPLELMIDNRSSSDITIYVVHDGRTERLDRIEAVRKKVLVIPPRMIGTLGDVRLIGEPQGTRAGFANRITTETVAPKACQRLEWTIEARPEQSTLGVFPTEKCGEP
jgi:hypothetical protein